MDDESREGRFYLTPIQRLTALLVLALAVGLVIVVNRAKPRPDRAWEWRYPDGLFVTYWPTLFPAPAEAMLQVTSMNTTNVFQFYRKNLQLPPTAGAVFMARSRGLFFARNMEETGVIPSTTSTNFRTEMFLNYHRGQSKILLASQFIGETNSAIWINMVETRDPTPAPTIPFLFSIEYPGSARGSGGSIQHATGYAYTVQTNLAAIEKFYTNSFGTNVVSKVQSNALRAIGDSQAQLFRLPSPLRVSTNEIAFLLLTTRTMSLIHAAGISSNSARMSIGVVAR